MQGRWTGARIGAVRIKNERLSQRINLHLALGGSFAGGEDPNAGFGGSREAIIVSGGYRW